MKRNRGFTLVEIMIVVIIIAVLSSVIIVLYKNTQERANAAKASHMARVYAGVFKLYAQDKHQFPAATGVYGYNDICLGYPSEFPAASGTFNAGDCIYNSNPSSSAGGDGHYRSAAWQPFMDAMRSYTGQVSNSTLIPVKVMTETWRGMPYTPASNLKSGQLHWYLPGDHQDWCAPGQGTSGTMNSLGVIDSTYCYYYL